MKIKVEQGSIYYWVTIGKAMFEVIKFSDGTGFDVNCHNEESFNLSDAVLERRREQAIDAVEAFEKAEDGVDWHPSHLPVPNKETK